MLSHTPKLVLTIVLVGATSCAFAGPTPEEEALAQIYGDEEFVSIATGQRQLLSQAPSVATVITAEDIEAIGATDLDQALETVPGLHVSRSQILYNPIYVIRGIHSQYNPQVLMLINGIPITNIFQGDRNLVWGGMPVKNIARIEVIRGPGSALYGADAFAGTINIVTKTAADITGTQAGVRVGSFNTKDAWVLHGGKWGTLDAAFALELHSTEGQREIIEADAGSTSPISASLAPGPVNTGRDRVDARLDLARADWRLRLGYQGRYNVGTGAGIGGALDPVGKDSSDRFNADLTYHDAHFSKEWDVTTQLSYLDVNQDSENLVLFPSGAFGGAFPQGFLGSPDVFERHVRAESSAIYSGIQDHRIRFGAGFHFGSLYKVRETKNFSPAFAPLGAVVDVSETAPFIRTGIRRVHYGFLQDEWGFAPDWTLTGGLRLDRYSDFGNTLNPRLALVWQTRYDLTTKLLYGQAFRAPSFAELFNLNNPVALGNPSLQSETIETTELAFNYKPTDTFNTQLGLFTYKMQDIIRFVGSPATAQNVGEQTGHGFEWEWEWKAANTLRLSGNYAWQRSTDEQTGEDAGNAPQQHLYARADWQFRPLWILDTQLNWIADRERVAGDNRPPVDDYTTVDLTLHRKNKADAWSLALSIVNVLDAEAREPALAEINIPNDLPLVGRSAYLELSYDFQ